MEREVSTKEVRRTLRKAHRTALKALIALDRYEEGELGHGPDSIEELLVPLRAAHEAYYDLAQLLPEGIPLAVYAFREQVMFGELVHEYNARLMQALGYDDDSSD